MPSSREDMESDDGKLGLRSRSCGGRPGISRLRLNGSSPRDITPDSPSFVDEGWGLGRRDSNRPSVSAWFSLLSLRETLGRTVLFFSLV